MAFVIKYDSEKSKVCNYLYNSKLRYCKVEKRVKKVIFLDKYA